MTITSLINHHCSRAYALTELLDTIHNQVYAALNDSTDDPLGVLESTKNLLHGAHELSDSLTVSMNDLFVKVNKLERSAIDVKADDSSPAPNESQIVSLGLNYYTYDALRKSQINTIDQLTSLSELDLIKLPLVGQKTLANIKERLAANGLSLSTGGAL